MSDSLFLLGSDESLRVMTSSGFVSEDAFQILLARFPELLTDADFGEGSSRRWVLVRREAGVADRDGGSDRWSLDHLFLDQDGVPTLVEVKRATDTRARREVVAQMLDYAANAVNYWRADALATDFADTCKADGVDPITKLSKLLLTDAPDQDAFWRSVQANLSSGRIRMVFVADRIEKELETIILFLNEQMRPASVLALELRPFVNGNDRILSPRLVGATTRANAQKRVASIFEGSVDSWIDDSDAPDVFRKFVDDARALGATFSIAGKAIAVEGGSASLRFAYLRRGRRLSLATYQLKKSPAFASELSRKELLSKVQAIGFTLTSNSIDGEPALALPDVAESQRWESLEALIADILKRLNN
jgi:hypothetical protein